MAGSLSMDDKLLGEKMQYYCSSSEDENEENSDSEYFDAVEPVAARDPEISPYVPDPSGAASNTGPKGVIRDWQRFKQLEAEMRDEKQQELIDLQKKLSLSCRSYLDDESANTEEDSVLKELEELDDDFMKEYRDKRLGEMQSLVRTIPRFDSLFELSKSEEFLEHIENQHPLTTVIIHVYEQNVLMCRQINEHLKLLSIRYSTVKFCAVPAHIIHLSSQFSSEGVPALLVYKNGNLIGNLVALKHELNPEFTDEDLASLLIGYGHLPESNS